MINTIVNRYPYLRYKEVSTAERRAADTSISDLLDSRNAVAYIMPMGDARKSVLRSDNCDVAIAATVIVTGGGFISSVEKCKDRLHVVLDALIMEIENDGTLQNIERKYSHNDQCEDGAGSDSGDSSDEGMTLNLRHTSGLFILTGVAMTCTFFMSKTIFDAGEAATKVASSFRIRRTEKGDVGQTY